MSWLFDHDYSQQVGGVAGYGDENGSKLRLSVRRVCREADA